MTRSILAFGIVKEICGAGRIDLDLPDELTAGMLVTMLKEQYPALNGLTSFALAVNGSYASPDTIISEHDEIAIIPPVSGG